MKSASDIISEALAAGQKTLSEYDSKRILVEYGIPTTQEFLIDELAAAEQAAEQIGYPVVLKVCAAAAQHKTEQNLIELGLGNGLELKKMTVKQQHWASWSWQSEICVEKSQVKLFRM